MLILEGQMSLFMERDIEVCMYIYISGKNNIELHVAPVGLWLGYL